MRMTNGEKVKAILKPRTDQIRIYGDWVEIEIQSLSINFSCELSWWNAEYKELTTKNSEVDCISRKAVLDLPKQTMKNYFGEVIGEVVYVKDIMELPPVTPQLLNGLEKDFGELDCISRADAIHAVSEALKRTFVEYEDIANQVIGKLPPVTPQESRKGHWIYDYTSADGHRTYHCSECGCYLKPKHSEPLNSFKWCSLCGADMREVEE